MSPRPATSQCRLLQLVSLAAVVVSCAGSYVITTPRKWTTGETVQVCVFSTAQGGEADQAVEVEVLPDLGEEVLVPPKLLQLPAGMTEVCAPIAVPQIRATSAKIRVNGTLGGKEVFHSERITFASKVTKTFIQTDKFLYKPNQDVQFRILTVTGPYLKISTSTYPLVWIEAPSGSRIAQWLNLENPSGLIHQSIKLSDEPEEGTYKIHVESPDGGHKFVRTFKVEEFVLPRFEVEVITPKFVLGTDKVFVYTVCANYTYGQPVKGNVTVEVENSGWGSSKVKVILKEQIAGCKDFTLTTDQIQITSPDYLSNTLGVTATVLEEGTGQEATVSRINEVHRRGLKFHKVGKEEFVKPNLPFTGRVKAKHPDGSPAPDEPMRVCRNHDCKTLKTDSEGVLEFIYPKHEELSVSITAVNYPEVENPHSRWRNFMQSSTFQYSANRYHSPSGSALVIHSPEVRLRCRAGENQEFTVPVLYSAVNQSSANFTVQLVSRGQIQFSHTQEYQLISKDLPIDATKLLVPLQPLPVGGVRGVVDIPVTFPLTSSPTAKVVVWYTRPDGEVVSDTQEVRIKKCFTNPVSLAWSSGRAEPGEDVNLEVTAAPDSLCSLGVVDKSVELLSSQEDSLTLDEVFNIVEEAMVGESENAQTDDNEYCRAQGRPDDGLPGPPGPPGPPGFLVPFAEEPEVLEDERVKRSFSPYDSYYTDQVDALKIFDKSGLFFFTDLTIESRPCHYRGGRYILLDYGGDYFYDGLLEGMAYSQREVAPIVVMAERYPVVSSTPTRTYFPETWLWDLSLLPATGVSSRRLPLPHTITEWVGKAVCVHPVEGLGVSKPATITAFTPFFIDLTLPPSVKRGEVLLVKISVFNYLDEALPVRVVLASSDQYDILDDPTSPQTNGTRSSCIPQQEKAVHTVKVRPLVLGDVNLTVEAFVDEVFPEACGPEYVISKRDHLIKPIPVELEGFPQEKTWTKYICPNDTAENEALLTEWTMKAPADIVEDSARAWVTAVGDLLGPTLENLGSLVRMPYGCGEQNMLNFAPNIFILQYLEASDTTTTEIAEKAIKFMKAGYQRELQYRHEDGSYSAFGSRDASGSTWLTAFVLKSFALARQFIAVDMEDVNMARAWLKRQQMENGCFMSVGKLIHKQLKGGIVNSDSPVPLSAYVLISLLESGEPTTSRAVSEAAFCLLADKESRDPYTLALKTYALALAGAPQAQEVLGQFLALANETANGLYWEVSKGSGPSQGVAVETAGYGVLAMTTLDAELYLPKTRKIVKWITSKRNGQGGFISTQDTVVALQALASFEMILGNKNVSLAVVVAGPGLDHAFHIQNNNKLLQQRVDVPVLPATVSIDTVGQGCALLQGVLRYNLPEETPSAAFTLSVNTTTGNDENCVTKIIRACASYQLSDQKSNMALIEVNLVSGYIPEKADLKQLVSYGSGLIKRYEVDGRKVTFYIDEFSSQDVCVSFRIIREVDVEDAKPGTVRVYDYYQPEYFVSQSYELPPVEECLTGPLIDISGIIVDAPLIEEPVPTTQSVSLDELLMNFDEAV